MDALKSERDALQDRLLRTAAEFDNYRKRIDRERREQADSAAASLLTEILPVVDNLERALQAPATPESAGYRAGVELIQRQMLDLLRKRGVTPDRGARHRLRSADPPGGEPGDERRRTATAR